MHQYPTVYHAALNVVFLRGQRDLAGSGILEQEQPNRCGIAQGTASGPRGWQHEDAVAVCSLMLTPRVLACDGARGHSFTLGDGGSEGCGLRLKRSG